MCAQEREEKLKLQAQIKRLWEDNQRLQEESQNSAAKLKKFTEWVFNTIDLNWERGPSRRSAARLHAGPTRAPTDTPTLCIPGSESETWRRSRHSSPTLFIMFRDEGNLRLSFFSVCRDECFHRLRHSSNPQHDTFYFFFLAFKQPCKWNGWVTVLTRVSACSARRASSSTTQQYNQNNTEIRKEATRFSLLL